MTTICMFCHKVKSGEGEPVSHGLCHLCWMLFYPDTFPKVLLAKNPDPCTACGYLETFSDFIQLEPQSRAVFFDKPVCVKRRGFCPLNGHYINFEEQEIVVVKMTDVVTGRKFERRVII